MFYSRPRSPRAYKIPRINHYSNPYFGRRAAPKKPVGFYYSLIFLFLAIAAWIYFLFASSVFQITEWEINGLKQYNKQEISTALQNFFSRSKFLVFKYSNIFLFNEDSFKKDLSSQFIFKTIEVKKYYPHKIIINVEEKREKLAVYNKNKIFVLADDGTVIREKEGIDGWYATPNATNEETSATGTAPSAIDTEKVLADAKTRDLPAYPIFCDAYYNAEKSAIGSIYPAQKAIAIINKFAENAANRIGLKIKLAALYKNQANLKIIIYTENNWQIYLNDTDDGLKQFYKFYVVFNDKIKDLKKPLEYIDLRFGDRVYIK